MSPPHQEGVTELANGVQIAWQLDDFTDPWLQPPTVMLLHGIAETSDAFRGWVPHLARHYRVLRVDLRGYGRSSPWQPSATGIPGLAQDVEGLVQAMGLPEAHLVGTKLGAQVALHLAQRQPPWLRSLSLAGVLVSPGKALGQWVESWSQMVDASGVVGWAGSTMPGRMGSSLSPAAMAWWTEFMGSTPAATVKACFAMLPALQEPAHLEQITCPTQVLVAVAPGKAGEFDQRQPVEEVSRWQRRIPNSRLCEIPADSYHIAASHPDACAQAVFSFLKGLSP